MAALLTVAGCGGADNKPTNELLRSANPLTSDIYVQVRGPTGAVRHVANAMMTGAFTKYGGGFFVPPHLHHRLHEQRACLFVHTIEPVDSPGLQAWRGQKITISVSGNRSSAEFYCGAIRDVFLGAS